MPGSAFREFLPPDKKPRENSPPGRDLPSTQGSASGTRDGARQDRGRQSPSVYFAVSPEIAEPEKEDMQSKAIKANRFDLGVMATKNREERANGGRDLYLGFRLVPRESKTRNVEEEIYWGAILPIQVGREHQELLGLLSVHYRTVYCHEELSPGTRIITRPGKYKTVGDRPLWVVGLIVAILAAVVGWLGFSYWQRLWPLG